MTTFTLKQPDHIIKNTDMHSYVGHVVSIAGYPNRKFLVVKDGERAKLVTLGKDMTYDFVVCGIQSYVYEDHGKLEVTE